MTFSINPTANQSQANFIHLAILQNGTAEGPSGTPGNYTTLPLFASTATPVTSSSLPPIASVILVSLAPTAPAPPPANLAVPPPAAQSGIVTGSGGSGCACSCLCGVAAFPAGAGIGMYGGYSGWFSILPRWSRNMANHLFLNYRVSSSRVKIPGRGTLLYRSLNQKIHYFVRKFFSLPT